MTQGNKQELARLQQVNEELYAVLGKERFNTYMLQKGLDQLVVTNQEQTERIKALEEDVAGLKTQGVSKKKSNSVESGDKDAAEK